MHGVDEPLIWGVWVSLSEMSFKAWLKVFEQEHPSHVGPFFGWLNAWLKPYPDTMNLKSRVHLRDHGLRPPGEVRKHLGKLGAPGGEIGNFAAR